MSEGILAGFRLIEGSAFVAAPLGGMTLAQLGADVIRFDQIGGGLDYHRWPLAADGQSLFWAGLNKGKRSIAVDIRAEEGREIVRTLIEGRDLIAAILRPRTLAAAREGFAGTGVSWGPYQRFHHLVDEDPRASLANPMFEQIDHPGVGRYLAPRSPLDFARLGRLPVQRAPVLGEHTEQILGERLGLSGREIGGLHDRGTVAGPGTPG